MFSTPLICCSIGVTTVEATMSALAPGYCPDTLMVGGAISGYCAIGRREYATPPTIKNTTETTAAKIGRSMKKCEMRIRRRSVGLAGRFGGRHARLRGCRLLLGRHLLPLAYPHQAIDDDAVAGREAVLDHAQVSDQLTKRHIAQPRNVVLIDHVDEFARLLAADGGVGEHQRLIRRRGRHLHAREHAGRESALGVVELRPRADRTGRAIDNVVDEVHAGRMRKVGL